MKLSKRLKQIEQLVTNDYDHIWDCCCDHGYLGTELLNRQLSANIHFVDIVPAITDVLDFKLKRYYPQTSNWQVHCLDVAKLPIKSHAGKHLVIIAGIGVDLMNKFITEIQANNTISNIEFILCPVNDQFALRQQLIALNFTLIKEVLVEENLRFYEVIFVSNVSSYRTDKGEEISIAGKKIWCPTNTQQFNTAQNYLNKTIRHYQKVQLNDKFNVSNIINVYKKIERKLLSVQINSHWCE